MKLAILFFVLLKATMTSFAGLASLPIVRDELVVERHMITDEQLDASVVITRSTTGPVGVYVVSVGYFAAGFEGAVAGWLAMSMPALVVILLVSRLGRRAEHPRVRGMLQCVVMTSAVLLALAAVPIARSAITDHLTLIIAIVGFLVLMTKRIDTLWLIAGSSALSLAWTLLFQQPT
jgi:chromate transporter